ncbi:hypothetical protein BU17DRAFT_103333 [Hysterangium stoloniferum]|nr:hypothetical protein BU17DRAFT_103333 [Hysterangium stoloniferum]
MTRVFSLQGWGQFTAVVVSTIIIIAFKKNDNPSDPAHVDFIWHLIIGLGCIPGAIALHSHLMIPETPRFTMDIERNVQQAAQDIKTFLTAGTFTINPDTINSCFISIAYTDNLRLSFKTWDNAKILVGAAYSWFALDIAFYSLGLNNSQLSLQPSPLSRTAKSFAILYRQPVPAQVIALTTIVIHNAVTQWRETGELKNMSLEDKNGYCAKYRKILEHLDIVQTVTTTA